MVSLFYNQKFKQKEKELQDALHLAAPYVETMIFSINQQKHSNYVCLLLFRLVYP